MLNAENICGQFFDAKDVCGQILTLKIFAPSTFMNLLTQK
jgi:hypothetical protein